jgi:lysophospholipase L1-like esterase
MRRRPRSWLPLLGLASGLLWSTVGGAGSIQPVQSSLARSPGVRVDSRTLVGLFRFQFGDYGPREAGPTRSFTAVSTNLVFDRGQRFGFDLASQVEYGNGCVTSTRPFFFSVALPEGNYALKLEFGDEKSATTNTVKAEMRRLMLEQVVTKPGEFVTREVTVNIRTPAIPGDSMVRLKQREKDDEMINWDDKLTLEFNGAHPGLASLEIRAAQVPTLFLLGDSTVCDQPREPWNSWGQMLPRFFKPGIAVANHAQSGESIRSSLNAKRFDKVFAGMKHGDWLFVQYGHNDMKDKATNALATYKADLRMIVARTREKGGTPVLVTSMERKAGIERDTLAGYPDAVREVAKEEGAALIDLHAMSRVLYKSLGSDLDKAFQDGTHHNNYGSYELARCVVLGIRRAGLPLDRFLVDDLPGFNPEHPDPVATFAVPPSPLQSNLKPEGN